MKKLFIALSLLSLLATPVIATAAEKEPEFVYTDAKSLPLFGKLTPDTYHQYSRLPEIMKDVSRKSVWTLGRHSAGMFVRFRTDAGQIRAKWTIYGKGCGGNMTRILKMGMVLYAFDKGEWVFVGCFRPGATDPEGPIEYTVSFTKLRGKMTELMVYLPMYDEVKDLSFGVPKGYSILTPVLESPKAERPIIAYGTSILQGASASNSGLAGTNLLSRKLDRVVVNLGFSGNAKLDMDVAEYMASYPDPGAYILDNAPNCSGALIREKQEEFYRILRKAHPTTPIIFVEQPLFPRVRFDVGGAEYTLDRIAAMDEVFYKLKKAGEKNIYLVKSDKMLLDDNIGTIEGTHFTDIAFERWADALYKVLKKVCK